MNAKIEFKRTEIGEIPEGWDAQVIADLPIDIIDGDRGVNYPKKNEFEKQGFCLFLNTKNVPGEHFDFSECDFISEEQDQILRKGKLQKGDIVLTTRGTVGNIAYYHEHIPYEHIRINSGMVIIRNTRKRFDTNYLYHLLKSPILKQQYLSFATGSAQPQLPIRDINKIRLTIPSILEQRAIAKILSDLDEKIELNHQINKTLESIAQAIFKRWFVDFEFPGYEKTKYVNGIPEGWRAGRLEDIVTNYDSKRVPLSSRERDTRKGIYPYYGAASVMDYVDDYIFNGTYILMGEDGTVIKENGYPILQYVWGKFWVNNHAHVLQGKGDIPSEYILLLLQHTNISHIVTGAVQPKINQHNMNNLPAIIPAKEIMTLFSKTITPLYNKVRNNIDEIGTLTKIRDSLLPRLISGKIRIN